MDIFGLFLFLESRRNRRIRVDCRQLRLAIQQRRRPGVLGTSQLGQVQAARMERAQMEREKSFPA